MMNLTDDHNAWAYMNPTMYYFGDQTFYEKLIEREAQHVRDFEN